MKIFRYIPKERKSKRIVVGISLRVMAIFYMLFLIGFQLQSPTTAYFSDTTTVKSMFVAELDTKPLEYNPNENEETEEVQDKELEDESGTTEAKEELADEKENLETDDGVEEEIEDEELDSEADKEEELQDEKGEHQSEMDEAEETLVNGKVD